MMMSESVNELEKNIASIQEEKAAHEKQNLVIFSFRLVKFFPFSEELIYGLKLYN